ncbi:MAG: M20 family metallopeptidase [Pyrinomonadaceae bacterium]
MDPNEILKYFQAREQVLIESIRQIVDIESPSHDAERSGDVVDLVAGLFRSTGADLEFERISCEDGDHLVIRAFPGEGKHTMLLGHTDTVHPVGTNALNPTRIEDGKFYGCGIFDMKANIVLMVEALRFLHVNELKPSRPISIFLSCDEEVGSFSGRPILERVAADADRCFVFEPSADGKVKTGRKGTGLFTVRTHGIPAHAGLEPEKGANAIAELARHIDEIHAIANPSIGTTVNTCTIRGGTTSNVIPEHAECEVDVRFSSMAEAERVDAAFRSLLSGDERVSLSIAGGINRPPMERTPAVIDLYQIARELAAGFDYELGETQVGGASDGNFVAALGVPVLDGLGIAGKGAHTLGEHILASDIARRATLVTSLLIE